MGSSSSKSSHSPQNPLHKEAKKPPILIMMEKLSVQLIAFRKREGLDQKQMAKLMGMGQSRYNEIEKVRNLNPEFGVSLCFLLRFAQLEKISLSALAESLQDQKPGTPSPRDAATPCPPSSRHGRTHSSFVAKPLWAQGTI